MKKFDVIGVIGVGAYGIVLKATNKESKEISLFQFIPLTFTMLTKSTLLRSRNSKNLTQMPLSRRLP